MKRVEVGHNITVDDDRNEFTFVGFPDDCTDVSVIADENGWHVTRSGLLPQGGPTPGTWIVLAKWTVAALPFPQLLQQIQQSDVIGRVTAEV